jgi:hypothetical protein
MSDEPSRKRAKGGLKFRNYNPTQDELESNDQLEKIAKPEIPDIAKQLEDEIATADAHIGDEVSCAPNRENWHILIRWFIVA